MYDINVDKLEEMRMKITTKSLVLAGLFIALSVILAQPMFKIPATSIGLDAMPAFFGAATIGPVLGGGIGAIAHLISAVFTGFPFTLPVHAAVAAMMFLSCFAYGFVRVKTNRYLAVIVGIVMNGPVSLAVAAWMSSILGLGFAGMIMFTTLLVPLTIASSVNVITAEVLVSLVGNRVAVSE